MTSLFLICVIGVAGCQKSIWELTAGTDKFLGLENMVQGMFNVNLVKIHNKLNGLAHTQEKITWSPTGQKCNQ